MKSELREELSFVGHQSRERNNDFLLIYVVFSRDL